MFNEYENSEGRIIHATSFAYETIYKAQGYKPRGEENVLFAFKVETAETPAPTNVGAAGGGTADSGAGNATTPAKPKRKSK